MKNVTGSETDTFDEVNKVLNRIIDELNSTEDYNAEVEEYNEELLGEKKGVN